jgi:deazaflavin-dependent oxidoreductase (nitroreductase family)
LRAGWLSGGVEAFEQESCVATARPGPALAQLLRAPVYVYRWRCGWLLGRRFLLLTHVGRRTGKTYQTVVEVMQFRSDGPVAVVMSGFGSKADWLRNIEAGRPAEVTLGRLRFNASHRILGLEEAVDVVEDYERRNRYAAPIVRAVLSRLLGWRYCSSDSDRRRLAEQLPLVALSPRV